MVTADAQDMQQDDMLEEFQKGNLTRGQLQRNAINILQFVLKSPAMLYEMDRISPEELKDRKNAAKDDPDVSKMMKFVTDEQGNIRISGGVSFGDAADAATDRFQAAVPAETHRWPGGSPGGKD